MKKTILILITVWAQLTAAAQSVGVGTPSPEPSAALEVSSTNKAFLPPRMNYTQILAIPNPVAGLVVYDIGAAGLRLFDGAKWVLLGEKSGGSLSDAVGTFSTLSKSGTPSIASVEIANDKSILLGGYASGNFSLGTYSYSGIGGLFFAKLDSNGTVMFLKILPVANGSSSPIASIDTDDNGNIYIGGAFSTSIDLDPSAATATLNGSGFHGYIAKYTPAGDYLWGNYIGGNGVQDFVSRVVTDGTVVYAGGSYSGTMTIGTSTITSLGLTDLFVAKYNANGTTTGHRVISMGNSSNDEGLSDLSIYAAGGVAVAGAYFGSITIDGTVLTSKGQADGFFVLINSLGTVTTRYSVGGPTNDAFLGMATDNTGAIYIGGRFTGTAVNLGMNNTLTATSTGNADGFVIKYSSTFNVVWSRFVTGSTDEEVRKVVLDANKHTFFTGSASGTDFAFNGMQQTSVGSRDLFFGRIDQAGTPLFFQTAGGLGSDNPSALAVSTNGRLVYGLFTLGNTPYFTFDKVRVNTFGPYIMRYEE